MKNTIILFIAALLMCTAQAWTQTTRTWEMTPTMTATLNDSILTISTTQAAEDMPNYSDPSTVPWYSVRETITSGVISDSVTSIGTLAFSYCYKLVSVTIPNSVTTIGRSAFHSCYDLASVTIPNSVRTIGGGAFMYGQSLTSITIPSSVTTIDPQVFAYSEKLISIHVDEANTVYSSDDGILYNKSKSLLHTYPAGKSGAFTIPASVTIIGDHAFGGCYELSSVTIPSSVTKIGYMAFTNCNSLTSVTIPGSVTEIGQGAFGLCTKLISIHVDAANTAYLSDEGVLYDKSKSLLNTYPAGKSGAFTIPASVTTIGDQAFGACAELSSVVIPGSVISIGYGAFQYCDGLTSVNIPGSVKSIGDLAFNSCQGLEDVTVGWSVPLPIYAASVFDWVNTAEVTLHVPYGTEELYRANAVWGTFNIVASPPVAQTWNLTPTMTATLLRGTLTISTTQTAEDMPDYDYYTAPWYEACYDIASLVIADGVTSIGDHAFFNCSNLSSVTIPNSVTTIGRETFQSCGSLTSITIPNSVTTISSNAFINCEILTSINVDNGNTAYVSDDGVVYNKSKSILHLFPCGRSGAFTIPSSVTTIGNYAFNYSKLSSVIIPGSVTKIEDSAFAICYGLTSITIPNSVTEIGHGAFQLCHGLTSVTIPSSVISIGIYAFSYCQNLASILVDAENTAYSSDDGVLYNKSKTLLHTFPAAKSGAFTVPASVIAIGYSAFSHSKLSSVTIPASVTDIGSMIFWNCNSLEDITVNWSTPLPIDVNAFYEVNTSDITLHVPHGTKALYEVADVWKDFRIVESPSPVGTQAVVLSSLKAYSTDAGLHIYGLTPGEPLDVYNIAGQLIYKGISAATEQDIPLYAHGIYIITTGKQSVKAAY